MAQFDSTEIGADIIRRYEYARGQRGVWEQQWERVARVVLPQYSTSFTALGNQSPGVPHTDYMVDTTAVTALTRFAAAMESMLTPRGSKWHSLMPNDRALLKNRIAREWYDDVNDLLFRYRYAPKANYASQQHETYMGLGAFGTGAKFIDALWTPTGEKGLRYRAIHLGEIYFYENHQGIIDTAIRHFQLTARQAVQQFEGLPEQITEHAKNATKAETKFWFVHAVYPSKESEGYDPERKDAKGMPYTSRYVSVVGKAVVTQKGRTESGFNVFPYPISRYIVAPGEVYGRSPAMMALPSIQVLNEEKKTVLKQGHRVVDPVLLAHDDGVLDGFSLKPGSINFGGVSADGRELVKVLPTGNLALAKEMMEAERAAINDQFLVTLFQILVETPQMTATEVLERAREKGALLSPTMGRQQSEDLGPTIERELDILSQLNLLPPMPDIVKQARGEYSPLYNSPLSRAQRAEEAAGFLRWIDTAKDYVQITNDPRPLDYANWDEAMPALADIQAVPARWVNDQDMVTKIRAARAQQQQQQQAIEAAPALAGAAKAMPGMTQGAPA